MKVEIFIEDETNTRKLEDRINKFMKDEKLDSRDIITIKQSVTPAEDLVITIWYDKKEETDKTQKTGGRVSKKTMATYYCAGCQKDGITHYSCDCGAIWERLGNEKIKSPVQLAVGEVIECHSEGMPTSFMECDGRELSITEFNELHHVVGYKYGGEGLFFSIPNFKGKAIKYSNRYEAMPDG